MYNLLTKMNDEHFTLNDQIYQMLCDDYDLLLDKLEEISYDDYDLEILGATEYE